MGPRPRLRPSDNRTQVFTLYCLLLPHSVIACGNIYLKMLKKLDSKLYIFYDFTYHRKRNCIKSWKFFPPLTFWHFSDTLWVFRRVREKSYFKEVILSWNLTVCKMKTVFNGIFLVLCLRNFSMSHCCQKSVANFLKLWISAGCNSIELEAVQPWKIRVVSMCPLLSLSSSRLSTCKQINRTCDCLQFQRPIGGTKHQLLDKIGLFISK